MGLQVLLKAFDFLRIEFALNGKVAVEKVNHSLKNNDYFSFIFMDINMPVMDGVEAIKLIRESEKQYLD